MQNNNFISNTIDYVSLSALSLTSSIVKSDNDKNFRINFEPSYSGFDNFIFFGSAEAITQIAIDRIIQTYPINLSTSSASTSAFEQSQKYVNMYSSFERKILEGFTNTVTGVYNSDTFSIVNLRRNSDGSLYDINDVNYVDSLIEESRAYDNHNNNMLQGFVPYQIMEYDENDILANLLNMFGQVFDEIMQYSNQFSNLFNTSNNYSLYGKLRPYDQQNVLTLLGFKVHTNFLFNNLINYLIKTETRFSQKAIQIEIWDRILSNLIYIYKTKGTLECFKAFLHVLGFNVDLVDMHEYVRFDKPAYITTNKVVNYFELLFDESVSGNISSSASVFNLTGDEWSIVYKFDLKGKIQTQSLFGYGDQYGVSIINTSVSSDYGEPLLSGYVSLSGNSVSGSFVVDTVTANDIFNNSPKTLIVTKNLSGIEVELSYINPKNELIILSTSSSISSLQSESSVFYLGRNGVDNDNSFVGSAINFKIFDVELNNEQREKYHKQIELINLVSESISTTSVLVNWDLNEPLYDYYRNNNFENITSESARIILDSSSGFATGSSTGHSNFLNGGRYVLQQIIVPTEKYVSGLVQMDDKISIGKPLYKNTNIVSISISPTKSINNAFEYVLGPIDFYDYFVSTDFFNNSNKYSGLERLKDLFYSTGVSIKGYETLIADVEEYAVGLFKSFYQFLPATAKLLYMGLLIESPIYDRNKHSIRNLELESIKSNEQLDEITQIIEHDFIDEYVLNVSVTSVESNVIKESLSADLSISSISGVIEPSLSASHDIDDTIFDLETNSTDGVNDSEDLNVDYLLGSDNTLSAVSNNNNFIFPLDVITKTIFDFSISGNSVIYVTQSMTGQTNLIFKYIDRSGDNIVGAKYKLTQNYGNSTPKFEIINSDYSSTSSNISQLFSMLNYSGSNLIFRVLNNSNIAGTSFEDVRNVVEINGERIDFTIRIMWIPDVVIVDSLFSINENISITRYPLIVWNLTKDLGTITATQSNYGSSLSSSFYTTSADFMAGSALNVIFTNYSNYKDGEVLIRFTVSGQQNLFVLESQNILDEFEQVGVGLPMGSYGYETAMYFKNSEDIKRFVLPKNKSKKFILRVSSSSSITAFTSGDINFYTNQPLTESKNKIFKLRFFAVPGNYIDEEVSNFITF